MSSPVVSKKEPASLPPVVPTAPLPKIGAMCVQLVFPDGSRKHVSTLNTITVADLATLVQQTHPSISARRLRLWSNGAELKSVATLRSYGFSNDMPINAFEEPLVHMGLDVNAEFLKRFNYDFQGETDPAPHQRGTRPYYRPTGSLRFAINVPALHGADSGTTWLGLGADAWPNVYIGVGTRTDTGSTMVNDAYPLTKGLEFTFDPPLAYFSVAKPEEALKYATKVDIAGHGTGRVILQARANPDSLRDLPGGWYASERAADLRPYSIVVYPEAGKPPLTFDDAVIIAAIESLQPYVTLLPKAQYEALPLLAGETRNWFSVATCHQRLCVGGATHPAPPSLPEQPEVTVKLPWPAGLPDVTKTVAMHSDVAASCADGQYTMVGPRNEVFRLQASLQAIWSDTGRGHWTAPSLDSALVVKLAESSAIYKSVVQRLKSDGLPTATNIVVEEIQNRTQYPKFSQRATEVRAYLDDALVPDADDAVRTLWHGPSTTAPSVIYQGNDGFQRNFASPLCFYGRGSYFSRSSKYSNDYAYVTGAGRRQMFLTSVCIGTYEVRAQMRLSLLRTSVPIRIRRADTTPFTGEGRTCS